MRSSKIGRAVTAALIAGAVSSSAWGTAGIWDTGIAGLGSGNGASSATPWISSPASGSSYAEWNFFNSYPTDNTPDIAGAGSVTETSGGAFLTSGGNIYGLGGPATFSATLAGGGTGMVDVFLRFATQGTLPIVSATLNGVVASAYSETFNSALGGFGGNEVEGYWHWSVAAAPSYSFGFGAPGAHMSLDQLALYASPIAAPVPEPGPLALMAVGLLGMGSVVRRRLKQRQLS